MMLAALRQVKEIRERMKKNRMKKRRASKHRSSSDDNDNNDKDDDDDGSMKKSSKKSKKSQKDSHPVKDTEKPSDTGKGNCEKHNKETSISEKKHKRAAKESDDGDAHGKGDSVNVEDGESDGGTKSKHKETGADKVCTENPDAQTDDIENSASADELLIVKNSDGKNSEKVQQSKTSKKIAKVTHVVCSADDELTSLDRELKNLAKLPKLKIKAISEVVCEEEQQVEEKSDDVSCASETATSKPEKAKKSGS